MDVVAERLMREHPVSNEETTVRVLPERLARPEEDHARSNARGAAVMLTLAGLLMVLAAANVGALLLTRASHRRSDLSIRLALGAARGQLVRQMTVEGVLLAGLGASAGIAIGTWATHALSRLLFVCRAIFP